VILDTANGSAANSGVLLFRGGTTDSNGTVNITVGAGGSAAVTHTTAAGTFNNNLNHIIGFTYQESRSPTEWELRLNRAATASGNSAIAPSVANPFGALTIGRLTSSNSLFWRGKQADIILVNRGVTTAEMIQVEDYILDYYGF
jgi:hypothetical protein